MSGPVKRSITIAGHRTSVSLEPVFWLLLTEAAKQEGKSIGSLVTSIDDSRATNLSSAIRTWLVERLRRKVVQAA